MKTLILSIALLLTGMAHAQTSQTEDRTAVVEQDDLRKIAEGNPSVFWRVTDQTRLEMSEDGGGTFRQVTTFPEKPGTLTTRADSPRSVFAHFPAFIVEVTDQGAMTTLYGAQDDTAPAGEESFLVEAGKNSGARRAATACTYTVSNRVIHLGVASGTTSMSIRGTCPWTVVTEDRAFARFYNAVTGSPILLPNKNLSIETQVRIEYVSNLSIAARGTVLLVLDASGHVVTSASVLQHGYLRGRSSDAVENPTVEVKLSAQAQAFEIQFRTFCRTCDYPRNPVPWIARIGAVPDRGPVGPLTLGFRAQENTGRPRAAVLVMYEQVSTTNSWSAFTTVIQEGK